MTTNPQKYIQQTRQWIESVVIDLNLCPFAKREMDNNSVRIEISSVTSFEQGVQKFVSEIQCLETTPTIGTTLLVFPDFLADFFDYLDFVDLANKAIIDIGYNNRYQLATFHPQYRFHNTKKNDVSNYTNRSPYPMLHILREEMLDRAIAYYGNTESIPENNILTMQHIGLIEAKARLALCMKEK